MYRMVTERLETSVVKKVHYRKLQQIYIKHNDEQNEEWGPPSLKLHIQEIKTRRTRNSFVH